MVQPQPVTEVEVRDMNNVPASTAIDQELVRSIRESYAASLASPEGPPPVEESLALELSDEEPSDTEDEYVKAYRPEWLEVGFHPHLENPLKPRHVPRASGRGRIELLDTTAWIFGVDDRILITPNTYPQSCVCHLLVEVSTPTGGTWKAIKTGTGFMVGPSHVATAAHVVPIAEINSGMNWRVTVTPASVDGVSVFGAGVVANVVQAFYYPMGGLPPVVPAVDMAMLRTNWPIGGLVGYLGALAQIAQGTDWYTIGYGYDRAPLRPKFQINVDVLSYDLPGQLATLPDNATSIGYEVETKADGASENSGSPLYKWFNTGGFFPEALADGIWSGWNIECGMYGPAQYHVFASGPLFGKFVTWARQTW